jgi:hypothetical protein
MMGINVPIDNRFDATTHLAFLAPAKSPPQFDDAHLKRTVQIARAGIATASSGPDPGQGRAGLSPPSRGQLRPPASPILYPQPRIESSRTFLPSKVRRGPLLPRSVRITPPRSACSARGNHGTGLPQALRRLLRQQGDAGTLSVCPLSLPFGIGQARVPRILDESIRSASLARYGDSFGFGAELVVNHVHLHHSVRLQITNAQG